MSSKTTDHPLGGDPPSVEEFESWTPEDDADAIRQAAERFRVRHVIKDGEYWGLIHGSSPYKLPLLLSIADFKRLSDAPTDSQSVDALQQLMRATFGDEQARRIDHEPVQAVMNLIADYGEVISRSQGVELGKSEDSSPSSRESTEGL